VFENYQDIIERFHQTLMQKDFEALRDLLAENPNVDWNRWLQHLVQLDLPLSGEIEVIGIELEGSGEIVTVHYISRLTDREYPMLAYLRQTGESIEFDYPVLQLRHIKLSQ